MPRKKREKQPYEFEVADLRRLEKFKSVRKKSLDVLRPMFDTLFRLFVIDLRLTHKKSKILKVHEYYSDQHLVVTTDGTIIEIKRVFKDIHNSSTQKGNFNLVDRIFFRAPVGIVGAENTRQVERLSNLFQQFLERWELDEIKSATTTKLAGARAGRLGHHVVNFYDLKLDFGIANRI